MTNLNSVLQRDPFADSTLVVNDEGITIRLIDGSRNNLDQVSLGIPNTPLLRLSPIEYEDGIQSPAGIAFDAEGNALIGIDGNTVTRQPIPIFTQAEADRLNGLGLNVISNTEGLSNVSDAPFVLLNPPDRPSTRVISNATSNLEEGESDPNGNGLSAFIWAFGQFVNHDTDLAANGSKEENQNRLELLNFPIDIPADDPNFPPNTPPTQEISTQADGGLEFDFERDAFFSGTGESGSPGKAINTVTSWLDLSVVYGSTEEEYQAIRAFSEGQLNVFSDETFATNDDLLPLNITGADGELISGKGAFMDVGFLAGDTRVNENDSLASQHTLWMRNHNRLAQELSRFHPDWTDEQIYQRSRQINIAQYQTIVLYEWLPLMVGDVITDYSSYNSDQTPEITSEFAAAGLRVGHTQTNNRIDTIDADGNLTSLQLLRTFGSPNINDSSDIDNILRGASQTITEDVDTDIVFDLRNALVPGAIGFDLYSANQQRGRDHGLADYNQVRASLGLPRVTTFAEITSNAELANTLENLYQTVEDIDLLIGLFAEDPVAPSSAGETIQAMLWEQYERIRDSDRFWFERPIEDGGFFTQEEIAAIKEVTFADIIKLNTEITTIPDNAFVISSDNNPSSDGLLDLTGLSGQATATVTREADYDNLIGFYVIADQQGTIIDSITGQSLTPGQEGYAEAAIDASVVDFKVDENLTTVNFDVTLPGGSILAPYLVTDGELDDVQNGDADIFFAFTAANSDGMSHILELGNGSDNTFTFAFEDLSGNDSEESDALTEPLSDRDFNDLVIDITIL
ncbi:MULTISPECIES: peroxidase family protein [Moorena]|uniref:Animal hem peroxidase family protein n=1 Tax=Moorena producens 3L TaxID=489825 RepID=F4XZX6_9CYAN|nr:MULTISPECIES: peroxidase family protein [Moorena]EGJ29894.1 animal hem peroxidase family protein [Moorena producens 3L]NEP66794.1 DUF4114 domain-containing protein [Moorena sp. SIO3A5]NES43437.1 DUF4114 domain-containing protein [Moorena sp. SIO2C4]OLT66434.1 heme peroxidase [Moorena producens 3L]